MRKSLLVLLLVFVLASSLVAGCGGGQKPEPSQEPEGESGEKSESTALPDEVRIGVWEPLTGNLAAGGAQKLEGDKLANEMRPTVLGKPVRLIVVDNKSDKVEAANSMARLIEQEKVAAVLGCYGSSLAIAGINVSEKAKIPVLPDASSPLVTQGRQYVTRTNYQDPFAGKVMAKYAVEKLGAKTAAIIQDVAQDYSIGLSSYFRNAFQELTGDPNSIVAVVSYNTGDQDFTAQLNYVKSKNPDVIFVPGYYGDGALLAKQAREMGIKQPLLGGDAWEAPELIEVGGKDAEGLTFCSHFAREAATSEKAKKFVEAYESKYGKTVNAYSAIAFDNYNLLLDAIEKVGSLDTEAINKELRSTKNWEGVTGVITIDETGNPIKPAPILRVENGEFHYVCTIEP